TVVADFAVAGGTVQDLVVARTAAGVIAAYTIDAAHKDLWFTAVGVDGTVQVPPIEVDANASAPNAIAENGDRIAIVSLTTSPPMANPNAATVRTLDLSGAGTAAPTTYACPPYPMIGDAPLCYAAGFVV